MTAKRAPEGPAPLPAVQRLRIRYAKRGRLRFSSTRDFQRALERALRRAQVPMAVTAGFHPHPRISYANAAVTGAASEAEYVEISVTERLDPQAVRAALDAALPPGLDVITVAEALPGSLAERLQASEWEIRLPGLAAEPLAEAVTAYLATPTALVTRVVKSGPRTFDTRAAVVALAVREDRDPSSRPECQGSTSDAAPSGSQAGSRCAILHLVVRHTTPAVRPDDILTALRAVAGLAPPTPPLVIRLAQGPLQDATAMVTDPLVADEEAAGA